MVAWNERRRRAEDKRPAQKKIGQYKIKRRNVNNPGKTAYELIGPRGAKYFLIRTALKPELMFAVNSHGNTVDLMGYQYFTDKNGYLAGA